MMIDHLQIPGSDGVMLHVAVSGQSGPVVLFLHGFPEFWQAWHRQLAEFGQDCRAVALDLRGYNLSDKPRGTAAYGLSRIAADVAMVIRAISPLEPVTIVGHDWGGMVAWHLGHFRPQVVASLVVINAPHPVLYSRQLRRGPRQWFASSYAAAFQLRGFAELALRAGRFALLRKMLWGTSTQPDAFPPDLRQAYESAWSQPRALRAALSYYRSLENLRLLLTPPHCWRVLVPTLVLWGARDPALVERNLEGLEDLVPAVMVHRHPDATHWIVHEQPAWVNDRIRRFMT